MGSGEITIDGAVSLEGGDRHTHAARRLGESHPGIEWQGGGSEPVIVLTEDSSLPEGAFRIEAEAQRITIRGGPFSGVIYGAEELIARGGAHPGRITISPGIISQAPGLTYRTFWTWDHSTNWELSQVGLQEGTVS